jgi:hypothetical protein
VRARVHRRSAVGCGGPRQCLIVTPGPPPKFHGARDILYDDEDTRDQNLVAAVSRIGADEMAGWMKVAAERPKSKT